MMGKMVDDMDRKRVITLSLITQNVCVLLCAVILYFILPFGAPHPPLGNWHFDALFAALVFVQLHDRPHTPHTPHAAHAAHVTYTAH
jgi:hypothetical protein